MSGGIFVCRSINSIDKSLYLFLIKSKKEIIERIAEIIIKEYFNHFIESNILILITKNNIAIGTNKIALSCLLLFFI